MLKAFGGLSDREIYQQITMRDPTNTRLASCAELLLRNNTAIPNLDTREQAMAFIGSRFRIMLPWPSTYSDEKMGRKLLKRFIFVHLKSKLDKCRLLMYVFLLHLLLTCRFMLQKLYALANGDIDEENVDSPMNHSLLLSGHLYLTVFKVLSTLCSE